MKNLVTIADSFTLISSKDLKNLDMTGALYFCFNPVSIINFDPKVRLFFVAADITTIIQNFLTDFNVITSYLIFGSERSHSMWALHWIHNGTVCLSGF